jgi:splicing factor 3B subunit 1
VATLGASDIDERLEVRLVDGIIYSFEEDPVMLDRFGTVVSALGIMCVKPYITQIVSAVFWRLDNKFAKVRQQATDLTTRLAVGEDQPLSKLGLVLFERLGGEEYSDTLGSTCCGGSHRQCRWHDADEPASQRSHLGMLWQLTYWIPGSL